MHKAAFQRPVFPRVSSAFRVITCRRSSKNRCGSWACKCICGFPRYGGKQIAHQRKRERARRCHCVRSLERCRDICKAMRRDIETARLIEFHRPQSTSTNLERLEVWPSHTPLEQGLKVVYD
ncbi:hypothetical protein AVEN_238109-1 [Araneus ventricosus]|uniref:Uncharacterized protein n=1 Tax=Araneus ventricosus TaxID=182803 RepID=A0A4Y2GJ28_ARAVE|nr:hypothetical protein AVEN_238109-1 [Araneus ventricosus]